MLSVCMYQGKLQPPCTRMQGEIDRDFCILAGQVDGENVLQGGGNIVIGRVLEGSWGGIWVSLGVLSMYCQGGVRYRKNTQAHQVLSRPRPSHRYPRHNLKISRKPCTPMVPPWLMSHNSDYVKLACHWARWCRIGYCHRWIMASSGPDSVAEYSLISAREWILALIVLWHGQGTEMLLHGHQGFYGGRL